MGEGGVRTGLQNSCIQTISELRSRTVNFSLRLKKSDHVITFLCLCGFENTDHVAQKKEKKTLKTSFHLLLISSDKAFPGLPVVTVTKGTRAPQEPPWLCP